MILLTEMKITTTTTTKGSHRFSVHKRNDVSIKESWMDLSNHYPNEEENGTMMKMWRIIWFLCAGELLPL